MMQELASRFRQNGLHIFRHRRGMLFVSSIRVRAFVHEHAGVSPLVNAILGAVSAKEGINRKQLFETLTGNGASEDAEPRRLALASDLRWLINEGYLIEFNDGSLDLPRMKSKRPQPAEALAASASDGRHNRHNNTLAASAYLARTQAIAVGRVSVRRLGVYFRLRGLSSAPCKRPACLSS